MKTHAQSSASPDSSAQTAAAAAIERAAELCQVCGAAARVRVLVGYADGQPVERRLCLSCADTVAGDALADRGGAARLRLRPAAVLIAAGGLLALSGVFFDGLGLHGSRGVGWLQGSGLVLGGLMVVVGALLRADLIAVVGTVLFGLALLADVCGVVGQPGFGWRQGSLIGAGVVLMLIGLIWHRRHSAGSGRQTARLSTRNGVCNL